MTVALFIYVGTLLVLGVTFAFFSTLRANGLEERIEELEKEINEHLKKHLEP